jgi:cephalosporin-C deacetylase-like acetyl esterase
MRISFIHFALAASVLASVHAEDILLQVEDFHGPWRRQTNIRGFLGKGFCTSNAKGISKDVMELDCDIPLTGKYDVWVRAYTSVGTKPSRTKRGLQVGVNGTRLKATHLSPARSEWSWQLAGATELTKGQTKVVVHDADVGYESADAILITSTLNLKPEEINAKLGIENLTVLSGNGDRLLHEYLLKEVDQLFEARRAEVKQALTSKDALLSYQKKLSSTYRKLLGTFPDRTPLNPVTTRTIECDGYRIENIAFESRPNHHVTSNLYVPTTGDAPFPGVLVVCGHSGNGKAYEGYHRACILLAKQGIVTLIVDPISQGERLQTGNIRGTQSHTLLDIGSNLVGRDAAAYELWDNVRSLDYLLSRSEVDPKRIGLTGNSGGGTQSAYLMAFDERIGPAAPSCFICSQQSILHRLRSQDGCQQLPGDSLNGLEHASYLAMRAPKPTMILAAEQDYFPIASARETFQEAKSIFKLLGAENSVGFFSFNDKHGFSKPRREAAARWMCRWLKGDDLPITEPDLKTQPEKNLWVTTKGNVVEFFKDEKTVSDFNLERANELASSREKAWTETARAESLLRVKKLIGLRTDLNSPRVKVISTFVRKNCRIEKVILQRPGEIPLPSLLFLPKTNALQPLPAVLYAPDNGKASASEKGGPLETMCTEGRIILAIDLRGFGELGTTGTKYRQAGFSECMLALHAGRPLLGQRVEDLQAGLYALLGRKDVHPDQVHLIATGRAGPAAIHFAALEHKIASLSLKSSVTSWIETALKNPMTANMLEQAVPGALLHYDLPDLLNSIAPRPVTIE